MGDVIILVSCMIINDKKEILLLFKKKHGFYETPGGKVHDNEDLETAALRELKEELGGEIKISPLKIFVDKHKFTIPDGRRAELTKFVGSYLSGKPVLMEPDIFDHFKWIPIKNIEQFEISPDLVELTSKLKKEFL
jgi:ADP-ribose pyrophosphatase YjhB (NUDIX family)